MQGGPDGTISPGEFTITMSIGLGWLGLFKGWDGLFRSRLSPWIFGANNDLTSTPQPGSFRTAPRHGEVSGGNLGPVGEPPSGGNMALERPERTGGCAGIL